MWPKRNYELGYGGAQNNRFRGSGGGYSRRGGNNYNSWNNRPGSSRKNYSSSWNRNKSTASKFVKEKKVGTKRRLDKSEPNQSKKRPKANEQKSNEQKVTEANNAQLPLTTIILAKPGNKSGQLPELVFNGFYECSQEAKIGRKTHYLRINVSRKPSKSKKQQEEEGYKANDRVSIPVPMNSIEAVSVISGMNPFEELMKAHASTISLRASMEHWGRVIERRTGAMEKKKKELEDLPEVEELEELSESEVEEEDKESEEDEEEEPEQEEEQPKRRSKRRKKSLSKAEKEKLEKETAEKKKLAKEKKAEQKRLAKEKKKADREERKKLFAKKRRERTILIKKRSLIQTSADKLESAVEKAKQGLQNEQKKLSEIIKKFGEELLYFHSETDELEALAYFESELKEGVDSNTGDEPDVCDAENEEDIPDDEDMDDEGENDEDVELEDPQSEEDVEMIEEDQPLKCDSCGAVQTELKKFCGDCGAKQTVKPPAPKKKSLKKKKVKQVKKSSENIDDIPVWIAIALNKPLEKFYASDANTTICDRDVVEKAELILVKFHPKHKNRIVLKNVTYEGAEEHLKLLNEVFEGPWKDIRVSPEELLKNKSLYSLEKIIHYLAKRHKRQEVADNTLEKCELCGKEIKRMVLERHKTHFCQMREEPCKYCDAVIVVSAMKEHEEICPKFPVPCPQKCNQTKLQRIQVEEHLKTCVNSIVECEFKYVGCNTVIKRKDIGRHAEDHALEHVNLLNKRVMLMSSYFTSKDPALNELLHPTPPQEEVQEEVKEETEDNGMDEDKSSNEKADTK